MGQPYLDSGSTIEHVIATTAGVKGDFRVSGVHVCCLLDSGAIGASVPAAISGKYRVTTDTGAAWVAGARVYLETAVANRFTTTSASNTFAGYAAKAKVSGATTAEIVLAGPGS